MARPGREEFNEAQRLLAARLPEKFLRLLASSLCEKGEHARVAALFSEGFTHYDQAMSRAENATAIQWLASDSNAAQAWNEIEHEEAVTATQRDQRNAAIQTGIRLLTDKMSDGQLSLSPEVVGKKIQDWFDWHGTLKYTWRLGVLTALSDFYHGDSRDATRPTDSQLNEWRMDALRGLRATKALKTAAFQGGKSQTYATLSEIEESINCWQAEIDISLNNVRRGFYPVGRIDRTLAERVLSYRYILVYYMLGLEPTERRIGNLLHIGGTAPAGTDRFRRTMQKMTQEGKAINPLLEVHRLFTRARAIQP